MLYRILVVFSIVILVTYSSHHHKNKKREDTTNGVEQVHVSLGSTNDQMMVTWITLTETANAIVYYGESEKSLNSKAKGTTSYFEAGSKGKNPHWIHRVLLSGLNHSTIYYYKCTNSEDYHDGHDGLNDRDGHDVQSDVFSFRHIPSDKENFRFIVFGDMGWKNAQTYDEVEKEVIKGNYDMLLHVGDMAYDIHNNHGQTGDHFMNMIQPIASAIPYQIIPGNHEKHNNFTHYDAIFTMTDQGSGDRNNFYYSFNVGPVHLIGFTTEFYIYTEFGTQQIVNQFKWLDQDLKEANRPENRRVRPWIVTMSHRPFYCSNEVQDCSPGGASETIRNGLEQLFKDHKVDLQIAGHEHCYERFYPTFQSQVFNGTVDDPYHNAKAPIFITSGAAGNKEGLKTFGKQIMPYSAFHVSDYGFSKFNFTHDMIHLVHVDAHGHFVDEMKVTKDTIY